MHVKQFLPENYHHICFLQFWYGHIKTWSHTVRGLILNSKPYERLKNWTGLSFILDNFTLTKEYDLQWAIGSSINKGCFDSNFN